MADTKPATMSDVELDSERRVLESRLALIEEEIHCRKLAKLRFKVGDVVRLGSGDEVKISHADPSGSNGWYKGRKRNKSGDWSKAIQHFYGMEGAEAIGHEDDHD